MRKAGANNLKKVFLDKFEVFAVLTFILALFLLDVNLNQIASYGILKNVPLFSGNVVPATSMFWLGFITMSVCFFIISVRSFHRRNRFRGFDILFAIFGIVGWGIILSGGLLIFFGGDNAIIPFFSFMISRIDYYHTGIGFEIITAIYFALTK